MYKNNMYSSRHERTLTSANTILSLVLQRMPEIRSAVDVGCGVGTWLSVLRDNGIADIRGFDGDWVDEKFLVIPQTCFTHHDLRTPIKLDRRFDLAISLEVAEHLPAADADCFVESLTSLSDCILFSAAIPYQGGRGHINEQWPDYWAGKFEAKGYLTIDFIRKRVWNNESVTPWYRQNILMFLKPGAARKYDLIDDVAVPEFLAIVHPSRYLGIMREAHSVAGTWKLFRRAIKSRVRGFRQT